MVSDAMEEARVRRMGERRKREKGKRMQWRRS